MGVLSHAIPLKYLDTQNCSYLLSMEAEDMLCSMWMPHYLVGFGSHDWDYLNACRIVLQRSILTRSCVWSRPVSWKSLPISALPVTIFNWSMQRALIIVYRFIWVGWGECSNGKVSEDILGQLCKISIFWCQVYAKGPAGVFSTPYLVMWRCSETRGQITPLRYWYTLTSAVLRYANVLLVPLLTLRSLARRR